MPTFGLGFPRFGTDGLVTFGAGAATPANSAPNTPTISAGTLTSSGATFTGSAFSDSDVGDTHAASQWRVTRVSDSVVVYNPGDDAVNKTSLVWSGGTAAENYTGEVRYKDSAGNYSTWSSDAAFTTAAAGGTTFTNAIRFDSSADSARAAQHASYNDLAAFTVALLVRWDATATTGAFVSKTTDNAATTGWQLNNASSTLTDFTGKCATTNEFKRAAGITADNSWQWLFIAYDRSAHTVTRAAGPQGGTVADIGTHVQSGGGAGAAATDAAAAFSIGSIPGGGQGARNFEVRFVGYVSSVLSLANMQAIADDAVAQAALFIDYWKPGASDTTQVPSAKSVLPALVYSGATLV